MTTIQGTPSGDVLDGGPEDDAIFGFEGWDTLNGLGGADRLYGGEGNDRLNGGEGDDSLYGAAGHDTLAGGFGDDLLDGGAGVDWASFAASGVGIVANLTTGRAKGEGSDRLVRIERIDGSHHADRFVGSSGDNILYGNGGDDVISAGSGGDFLQGGEGRDILSGGAGRDAFIVLFFDEEDTSPVSHPDTIMDWSAQDSLYAGYAAGDNLNYAEAPTQARSLARAQAEAEAGDWGPYNDYVFLYNAATDTGYLLADNSGEPGYETGVILRGAGSAADMNWRHLVSDL